MKVEKILNEKEQTSQMQGLSKMKVVRTAVYARVSTDMDIQKSSLEEQMKSFRAKIDEHPGWVLVDVYADEGISGTRVKHRKAFLRMIKDCEEGKVNYILAKSISRFARNTVECLYYVRYLQSLGVQLFFEKENIRTDDPTSSFVLSLMSAVAQDESHSISMNVKMGYRSRYKRGEYNLGNNRMLGYDCIRGKLVPNKDADIVRTVFSRFLEGQTYREIADGIQDMGATTMRGKSRLSPETIRYMLGNETYVGDKLLQKQAPRDYLTKKPDPNIPYQSVYLSNDHEAIIDRETWEKVQGILQQRKEAAKAGIFRRCKEHHILYGKVFCGECGAPFIRRTYRSGDRHYKAWNCKERQKGSKGNGCKNVIMREDVLIQAILDELGGTALDEVQMGTIQKVLVFTDGVEIVR